MLVDSGAGEEVFSFAPGDRDNVISDFKVSGGDHDFVQLKGFDISSFSQVQSDLSQVGADTLLTLSPHHRRPAPQYDSFHAHRVRLRSIAGYQRDAFNLQG